MAMREPRDMSVGLRALREEAGLSRERLVRRLKGVYLSGQGLVRIEAIGSTTTAKAFALADALSEALGRRVTVEDLFPNREVKGRKRRSRIAGLGTAA